MSKVNHLLGGNLKERNFSIIAGALKNDFEMVQNALNEDQTCINDQDERMGVTALHIAAGNGNLTMVDFLCGQPGCDPFIDDFSGRSTVTMASAIGRRDIVRRIQSLAASLTFSGEDDAPPSPQGNIVPIKPRDPKL